MRKKINIINFSNINNITYINISVIKIGWENRQNLQRKINTVKKRNYYKYSQDVFAVFALNK